MATVVMARRAVERNSCRIDIGVLMIRHIFCAIYPPSILPYPWTLCRPRQRTLGGKEWKISADDRRQPHPTAGRGLGGADDLRNASAALLRRPSGRVWKPLNSYRQVFKTAGKSLAGPGKVSNDLKIVVLQVFRLWRKEEKRAVQGSSHAVMRGAIIL